MSRYVDLSEKVTATFYDQEYEEWTKQTVTVEDVLDSVCDDYTVLPTIETEQRWIPCSEGLPTIETDVLVTAHNGTTQYVAWMDAFEKWHSDEEEVIKGYEPLAWMPLPEPYKLERGEQDE